VKKAILITLVVVMAISAIVVGRMVAINYFRQQAYRAEESGNYAKALSNFNKVMLLTFSKTPEMYTYQARLYFNNGNIKLALQDLQKALSDDKNNPDAHLGIGLIRLQEGDTEEAIKEFSLVIKERPKWTEAYMSRQVAYRKLGEKKKAIEDLNTVLKIAPDNEWARKALKALGENAN
jgi:tetratricopeptide (TPR) repeat protein